jgi:hypothetical protein
MIAARLPGPIRMATKVPCPDGSHLGSQDRIPTNQKQGLRIAHIMIGTRPPEVVIMRRLVIANPRLTDDAESAISRLALQRYRDHA